MEKDGDAERVDTITKETVNPDNIDNFLVKVTMKDIPAFYSKVTGCREENNQLKLTLEYQDAMVFTKEGQLKPLEVSLEISSEEGNDEYQYNNSFKSLYEAIKAKPDGEFTLTKDYDVAQFATNNDDSVALIPFEFTGKLNGNRT